MGRSKCPPLFGKSEGERLILTLSGGSVIPLFARADRTRCLDSKMELWASPVMLNCGKPLVKAASTSTTFALVPKLVAVRIVYVIYNLYSLEFLHFLSSFSNFLRLKIGSLSTKSTPLR